MQMALLLRKYNSRMQYDFIYLNKVSLNSKQAILEKYSGDSREVKRYLNCKFDFYKDFVVKAQEMKNKS